MKESRKFCRVSYEETRVLGVPLAMVYGYLRKTKQYYRKGLGDGFFEVSSEKFNEALGLDRNQQNYYLNCLIEKGYILRENRGNVRFVKIIKKVDEENE